LGVVEIDVGPPQSGGLAAAQAPRGEQPPQGVQAVVAYRVQELGELFGCPDRDDGPFAGGLPGGDAWCCSDHGVGPFAGR
jgi:hypothetical protein